MDETATNEIEQYFPLVWSIARKYAGLRKERCRDDSDIYSEGLLGLLKGLETYDETRKTTIQTWIRSTVTWQIRDYLRLGKSKILNSTEFPELIAAKEPEPMHFDDVAKLRQCAETLENPKLRRILELRIDGKTWQEIGDSIGRSKQAVEQIFNRRVLPVLQERFRC
jgi:RNA polymerase sigma factor (sigma-70 family)